MTLNVRYNLRVRATLFVLLVITLSLAAVLMTVSIRINRYIEHEQQALADVIADTLARAVSEPLAGENTEGIERVLRSLIATPNVLFMVVSDPEGRILAQEVRQTRLWSDYKNPQEPIGEPFISAESWVVAPGTRVLVDPLGNVIYEEESEVPGDELNYEMRATNPAPRFIGKVMVAVSRSPTVMAQNAQQRIMIAVFAFTAIVGGLVVFIAVSHWTRKLDRLVQASWRIAHGDLSHAVSVNGEDEVGRLAEAFESMRKSLKRRDTELKKLNETLKQQIKDRTLEIELEKDRFEADTIMKSSQQSAIAEQIRRLAGELSGDSELLLKDSLSDQQRRGVASIKEVTGTLQTLAQSIVSTMREMPAMQPETKEPVNLYTMVETQMRQCQPRALTQNVLLLYDFSYESEHWAFANKAAIAPLIRTALEEALLQAPGSCVTMEVWRNSIASNQALFSFEIRCQNLSSGKDEPVNVFRRFLSLHISSKASKKRGPDNLMQQVERAGGRLHIETHRKKGSLLRFEFVLVTDMERSVIPLITPSQKNVLDNAHVLLASTSEAVRAFMHKACESAGIRLVSVSTEQKLWSEVKHGLLTDDPYTCIIIDSVADMNADALVQKIDKELPGTGFETIVIEPYGAVVSDKPSAALTKAVVKGPLGNIDVLTTLFRVLKA